MKSKLNYFTKSEHMLWSVSSLTIIISFCIFDRANYLTLAASLVGVTSLIFNAKGNPFGQVLMIAFSVLYGIISLSFAYYGEMITYLGMTAPMAVFSLISWVRNPYDAGKSEVKVNSLRSSETVFMLFITAAVTIAFYFILKFFNTASLLPSTVSVTTSFLAAYLTFRRSIYFALAYAANDVVLIVLWAIATASDTAYLSVTICFAMFLANDIYGFISWSRMKIRQASDDVAKERPLKMNG